MGISNSGETLLNASDQLSDQREQFEWIRHSFRVRSMKIAPYIFIYFHTKTMHWSIIFNNNNIFSQQYSVIIQLLFPWFPLKDDNSVTESYQSRSGTSRTPVSRQVPWAMFILVLPTAGRSYQIGWFSPVLLDFCLMTYTSRYNMWWKIRLLIMQGWIV